MSPKWYAPILLKKTRYGIENSKTIENKKKKMIQFEKLRYYMVVAPKPEP